MVSKTLKKKVPAKKAKSVKAVPVVDSAKEIWFAGLGAFSVVQQEGEKLIGQGTKLFDKLVSEGARVEKESIDFVDSTVDEIKHDVEKSIKDARRQANESWDNLGSVFDERVSGTLERLGIPTTKDLSKLSDWKANSQNGLKVCWKVCMSRPWMIWTSWSLQLKNVFQTHLENSKALPLVRLRS
jgi:poly(hydroxyalkanoate) granule-associated protein